MQLGTVQQLPSVNGSAPLARGLRAWYMTQAQSPGSAILQDLTANGFHGQLLNSATSFAKPPQANAAFMATDYNGTNGAAKVLTNNQTTNFFLGGGMFAAWVCVDSYTVQPRLFDKNQSYAAFTANSSGNLSLSLFQWFNFGSSIGIFASTTPNDYPVPLGTWTHIAFSYSSSNAANVPSIYINGKAIAVAVSSTPTGSIVSDISDQLYIGNAGDFGRPLDGRMFDVRFYSGFIPDANFVRSVYLDAANGFAGTLATSRRHRQKKGASATGNRIRRVICSGGE